MFILSRFVSVEIYFFLASSHRGHGKRHCWQSSFVNEMNPSFQLTSVFVFYLQVEENSTEDKSKDGAPLDSQSEATNYFLQYIATPRWWSILLFWPVLAFLLHSHQLISLIYFFILFCCCSFSSKNAANSAAGEAKFVFGQNMSERVLVSEKKKKKYKTRSLLSWCTDWIHSARLCFVVLSESSKGRVLKWGT